jgi:anti-anti-sigma factor
MYWLRIESTHHANKELQVNISPLNSTTQIVGGVRELVRGKEQEILEELRLLVLSRSVCLDLSLVERIDAAGLAALVSLYCAAAKARHDFSVINPRSHVARILAIVGLDRILVSTDTVGTPLPAPQPRMDSVAA